MRMRNQKLPPVLLVSDVDGTLMTKNYEIPSRNLTAIQRFQKLGGFFALATGRSEATAAPVLQKIEPNAPGIFLNGVVIGGAGFPVITENFLPEDIDRELLEFPKRFPKVGIEIFTRDGVSLLQENSYTSLHTQRSCVKPGRVSEDGIPGKKCKLLFLGDTQEIEKVENFFRDEGLPQVHCFRSSAHYLELVRCDVNKGNALVQLAAFLSVPPSRVYAIGDNDNDRELIQSAGFGAAPENAVDEIKSKADLVVCDCGQGAVADFIEYLIMQISHE